MNNIFYKYKCWCGEEVKHVSLKAFFIKWFCNQDNIEMEYKFYMIIKMSWKFILKSFFIYRKRYGNRKYKSSLDFWQVVNSLNNYEIKPTRKGVFGKQKDHPVA